MRSEGSTIIEGLGYKNTMRQFAEGRGLSLGDVGTLILTFAKERVNKGKEHWATDTDLRQLVGIKEGDTREEVIRKITEAEDYQVYYGDLLKWVEQE